MNVIIIGRLFQAAFAKPKNPTNGIHYASPLWRTSINKAAKRSNSITNLCEPPTLYCGNCRKYKNFGHQSVPPPSKFTKIRYFVIAFIPLVCFVNWKFFLYLYKKDWYDKVDPEVDREHLYPSRPMM